MKKLGADIPSNWLLFVPLVNIWWAWKYSKGVEQITAGKLDATTAVIMLLALGDLGGTSYIQSKFNQTGQTLAPTFVGDVSSSNGNSGLAVAGSPLPANGSLPTNTMPSGADSSANPQPKP